MTKLLVHDLKNPIAAISANLSYLESFYGGTDEDVRETLTDCATATKLLLQMVDNMLLISRLEVDEHMSRGPVELSTFVEAAVQRAAEFAVPAGVRVELAGPPIDGTTQWEHDYAALALDNLVLSAVHNSPTGGRVTVRAQRETEQVRIRVADDGRPVEDRHREQLFLRECQTTIKGEPGARYSRALGLYAVGLAARFLGGDVETGVRDGRAEFTLLLPCVDAG